MTYRLRDWVFSRQRYWGEPIPIYFPVECAGDPRVKGAEYEVRYDQPIAVEESELPLLLPDLEDFQARQRSRGPARRAFRTGASSRRTASGSRARPTRCRSGPARAGTTCASSIRGTPRPRSSPEAYDAWMPVDLYVGGGEHAVLHLLYARFWHKVLFDIGLVKHDEPFTKLVHQGIILGEDNQKMSKARGNVVNPDSVVRTHGADALRLYEMFMGPLEQVKPWQASGIEGVRRFLERSWNVLASGTLPISDDPERLRRRDQAPRSQDGARRSRRTSKPCGSTPP